MSWKSSLNIKLNLILFLGLFLTSQTYAYDKPIFLGNPYKKYYKSGEFIYARNIWDLQLFQDKIYIGAGNSSNYGPAQNAGPLYVISLDTKTNSFKDEYKIDDEQIDVMKVYDDTLYIAGHDATQSWDYGNIYTKKNQIWEKNRTLPKALHVYDLVIKDKKIFTAIGLYGGAAVFVSDLDAQKWKQITIGKGRVYTLLEVSNQLFATKTFRKKQPDRISIAKLSKDLDDFTARFDLDIKKMFPNTEVNNNFIKIIKAIKNDEESFYIGAYKYNDHQNKPFGLYKAYFDKDMLKVEKIALQKDYIPRDILIRDEKVYILVTKKIDDKFENIVLQYENNSLEKLINFEYNSFARSFEEYKNCFYFGIGSEINNPIKWSVDELSPSSGDILRVCR